MTKKTLRMLSWDVFILAALIGAGLYDDVRPIVVGVFALFYLTVSAWSMLIPRFPFKAVRTSDPDFNGSAHRLVVQHLRRGDVPAEKRIRELSSRMERYSRAPLDSPDFGRRSLSRC